MVSSPCSPCREMAAVADYNLDVTIAKDGQEAFELVKESMEQHKLFNLIFMDIQVTR